MSRAAPKPARIAIAAIIKYFLFTGAPVESRSNAYGCGHRQHIISGQSEVRRWGGAQLPSSAAARQRINTRARDAPKRRPRARSGPGTLWSAFRCNAELGGMLHWILGAHRLSSRRPPCIPTLYDD